jgi:hypothetical protein
LKVHHYLFGTICPTFICGVFPSRDLGKQGDVGAPLLITAESVTLALQRFSYGIPSQKAYLLLCLSPISATSQGEERSYIIYPTINDIYLLRSNFQGLRRHYLTLAGCIRASENIFETRPSHICTPQAVPATVPR